MTEDKKRIVVICPYKKLNETFGEWIPRLVKGSEADIRELGDGRYPHLHTGRIEEGKPAPYAIIDFGAVLTTTKFEGRRAYKPRGTDAYRRWASRTGNHENYFVPIDDFKKELRKSESYDRAGRIVYSGILDSGAITGNVRERVVLDLARLLERNDSQAKLLRRLPPEELIERSFGVRKR